MSVSAPRINGLLSEDRVAYAVAVREWAGYISAVLREADHCSMELLSAEESSVIWRHSNNEGDALDFRLWFGSISAVTIKQTTWYICDQRRCACDHEGHDEDSTVYFTIAYSDFRDFGLSLETPKHWQYLQTVWEDGRRCTKCLQPKTAMCDCYLCALTSAEE